MRLLPIVVNGSLVADVSVNNLVETINAGYNGIEYNSARHITGKNILFFDNFDCLQANGTAYLVDKTERIKNFKSKIIDI